MSEKSVFNKIRVASGLICYEHQRKDLLKLNCACAEMLQQQGLLTDEEYALIKEGLLKSYANVDESDFETAFGDIHYAYESALFKLVEPKVACKLHVGRSRNDMYFTLYRMSVRSALLETIGNVLSLQNTLEKHINDHLNTIIPYYTYGQPSQPGTWGHYLESIHELLTSDLNRLKDAYTQVNRCPMGAAAGIGTAFNLNREKVADLLGFDGVVENTVVAISDENYYLQAIFGFTALNNTLKRLANDLEFFSSNECGFLDCDSQLCGGSSIMPQKKNAEAVELLRTMTSNWNGYFLNCLQAASTSVFPVHETYYFYEKFWDNVGTLNDNILLTSEIINGSKIREDVAYARAREGFTAATGMAEELTKEVGEPFEITHHVVGGMIKHLMSENRLQTINMTPDLMRDVSKDVLGYEIEKTQDEISALLDPLESLNAKVTSGTPNPQHTRLLLATDVAKRKSFENWYDETQKHLADCRLHLIGNN